MPRNSHALNGARHLPPTGRVPSAAELLVCTLLYSNSSAVIQIAEFIDAEADLDGSARRAYRAMVSLARLDISPAPELVLDELRRTGQLDRQTACWLATAVTAGAPPETVRRYAAIVVAECLRRQVESWALTLVAAAGAAAEDELKMLVDKFSQTVCATFDRLGVLRGSAHE
jgi:replicative DNA helicase